MEPHKVDFEMGEKVTAFVARDFSRAGTYGGLRINEISGIASGPEIVLFDTKLETLSVEKKDGLWKVTDHRQDSDHFISFAWDRATIAEDVKSYLKEKTDQLKEMEKQFKAFAVSSPDTGHP